MRDVADIVVERLDVEALAIGLTATAQIQCVHRQPICDELLSRPRVIRAVGIEARNDHDRRSRCETRTPGAEEDLKACAFERSLARDRCGHRLHLHGIYSRLYSLELSMSSHSEVD